MQSVLERLAPLVRRKLARIAAATGSRTPAVATIRSILHVAYYASMRTEESRHVRPSVTFAPPDAPDPNPPITRRANYPTFHRFDSPLPLTTETLVKLARAVDWWSGSIAVFGTTSRDVCAWGIADQMVLQNMLLNRESERGFANPGLFTVVTEGIGDIAVYHKNIFLGGARHNDLRTSESEIDVFSTDFLIERSERFLATNAERIAVASDTNREAVAPMLYQTWANTVARLCIGVRRLGTGGTILMTPQPSKQYLSAKYGFGYRRLGESMTLSVLDRQFRERAWTRLFDSDEPQRHSEEPQFPQASVFLESATATQLEDRVAELGGAVKVVSALGCVDGLVLLDMHLNLLGYGAKISVGGKVPLVIDGRDINQPAARQRTIDVSRYGTRHASALRYCSRDREAIAFVVSQDGYIRMIAASRRRVFLWENVRVVNYRTDITSYCRDERRLHQARKAHIGERNLGYGPAPKTMAELLRVRKPAAPRNPRSQRQRSQS